MSNGIYSVQRGPGEPGKHGREPQETRQSPPQPSPGTSRAADFDRLPPCPDTVLHEHTWAVEIFIASDSRHKALVLLRVHLGFYFFNQKRKNYLKTYLHMTVHICNVRHMHTIWRASHAVTIYTASKYNIKVVFTSSLKQDTFEHMMSYTYLPFQLLPTRIYSNIQIHTLKIPKSGKAETYGHKGTAPSDVGARSQPHVALATCRGAGTR